MQVLSGTRSRAVPCQSEEIAMTKTYRRIGIGEDAGDAVTVGIERGPDGALRGSVWWPSRGDVDPDEASYESVDEAMAAAEAARTLHGFPEVVVMLQSDDLWSHRWGRLLPVGMTLSQDEAFELARATEVSRDA